MLRALLLSVFGYSACIEILEETNRVLRQEIIPQLEVLLDYRAALQGHPYESPFLNPVTPSKGSTGDILGSLRDIKENLGVINNSVHNLLKHIRDLERPEVQLPPPDFTALQFWSAFEQLKGFLEQEAFSKMIPLPKELCESEVFNRMKGPFRFSNVDRNEMYRLVQRQLEECAKYGDVLAPYFLEYMCDNGLGVWEEHRYAIKYSYDDNGLECSHESFPRDLRIIKASYPSCYRFRESEDVFSIFVDLSGVPGARAFGRESVTALRMYIDNLNDPVKGEKELKKLSEKTKCPIADVLAVTLYPLIKFHPSSRYSIEFNTYQALKRAATAPNVLGILEFLRFVGNKDFTRIDPDFKRTKKKAEAELEALQKGSAEGCIIDLYNGDSLSEEYEPEDLSKFGFQWSVQMAVHGIKDPFNMYALPILLPTNSNFSKEFWSRVKQDGPLWLKIGKGKPHNWEQIFAIYNAQGKPPEILRYAIEATCDPEIRSAGIALLFTDLEGKKDWEKIIEYGHLIRLSLDLSVRSHFSNNLGLAYMRRNEETSDPSQGPTLIHNIVKSLQGEKTGSFTLTKKDQKDFQNALRIFKHTLLITSGSSLKSFRSYVFFNQGLALLSLLPGVRGTSESYSHLIHSMTSFQKAAELGEDIDAMFYYVLCVLSCLQNLIIKEVRENVKTYITKITLEDAEIPHVQEMLSEKEEWTIICNAILFLIECYESEAGRDAASESGAKAIDCVVVADIDTSKGGTAEAPAAKEVSSLDEKEEGETEDSGEDSPERGSDSAPTAVAAEQVRETAPKTQISPVHTEQKKINRDLERVRSLVEAMRSKRCNVKESDRTKLIRLLSKVLDGKMVVVRGAGSRRILRDKGGTKFGWHRHHGPGFGGAVAPGAVDSLLKFADGALAVAAADS